MAATYTPVDTPKDQVRLTIGDTDVTNAMLQDEEITYYLTEEGGNVLQASARAAGAIAAKFARLVATSVGDVRVEAQQQFEHYRDMASDLSDQAVRHGGTAVPYAGGLTVTDVGTRRDNTELVDPFFTRTTGDNPPRLRDEERWPC